jgi:hypothetical protein
MNDFQELCSFCTFHLAAFCLSSLTSMDREVGRQTGKAEEERKEWRLDDAFY